ncbi:MAG TPA: regulatory protein RecX [Thermoanaerobaculia bacterium]|nr:regulatory protein RecX [Thermoanaerobaculia bacterium]
MRERGFDGAAARQALDRLEAQGWLDDLSAAKALVRTRAGRYGRFRIAQELSARGFSEETVERALAEAENKEEAALAAVFRKIRDASSNLPAEKRRRRIWGALTRRGFEPGAISAMMKGCESDDDEIERNS